MNGMGQRLGRILIRKFRYWANFDWREFALGFRSYARFRRLRPADRTVLIVEPNRYHAEVLPGYAHHFQQLGYAVVMMLRRENERSGAFVRVPGDEVPASFAMHPRVMRRALTRLNQGQYAFVFLTSAYWIEPFGHFGLFCGYLGKCPRGVLGYAAAIHEFQHVVPDVQSGRIDLSKAVLLSEFEYAGSRLPMVNPHYFGRVAEKASSSTRVFIAVGHVATQRDTLRQVMEAVRELTRAGISSFRVMIAGRDPLVPRDFGDIPENLELLGPLGFPELFAHLEEADFFLPMLDASNEGHRSYLSGKTSGSKQLILGFLMVPVMQKQFAEAYGFSDETAVLYQGSELADAMRRAIALDDRQYSERQTALKALALNIESRSLKNLSRMLESPSDPHGPVGATT